LRATTAARASTAYATAVEELRLNPGQWKAYNSTSHCVVTAGPGSGKTKTLSVKIAKLLIEEIREPRGLACITYSAECARELKSRLERLGVHESRHTFVGTVHSFCLRELLLPYAALAGIDIPHDFKIATGSDQAKQFARAVGIEISADERPLDWRSRTDEYRRTRLDRESAEWREDEQLSAVIVRYEKLLRRARMIDFDDMVLIGLGLVESYEWIRRVVHAKFPVIVVDEYQDLGVPLHRIVDSLCFEAGSRLFAVGDPDQSIYGFTGARPELLRELSGSPKVEHVRLPFNYRSGPTIVRASEIALGEKRGYEARGDGTGTVDFHERPDGIEDQCGFICRKLIPAAMARRGGLRLGDIAVLYLDKNDGDVIAREVEKNALPFVRIDKGAPYPKTPLTRWLEDCAAWCSGGWMDATPRLSELLFRWGSISGQRKSLESSERSRLISFLLSHRDGNILLRDWLASFSSSFLAAAMNASHGLGDERDNLAIIAEACGADGEIGTWTIERFAGQGGSRDNLNLITLHSAKGLEFRIVIMMGMDQGRIPRWNAGAQAKHEQRRLFYVGLTRAKEEVHLTYSGWTINQYGRRFDNGPSEFLEEVQLRLDEGEP
jgi:DNA helicase-2/ATP-dependent DNA helicase PcrA